ncbi:1,2-phenylacetyl-CoA epoxidase subunit PaaD [Corynebacterium sp. AOP40-9SA-29]|uniref:1,2-phenylacetyl-CoA epoxidase subunit PaaD n=1 Tax=Corynebacterium sp. AOP40-9SA-29 TaxID=3457677 RepID=UPI004034327D
MVTANATAPGTQTQAQTQAWTAAATVTDPEIPVITIADLGILRKVTVDDDSVTVTITPTYSGCPAMSQITADVTEAVSRTGFDRSRIRVETVLSPAWTTDWMTEQGKQKLKDYGIAPPTHRSAPDGPVTLQLGLTRPDVACPLCDSHNTRELTRFASTSCKALYVCSDCHEPFDYFKVH